MPKFTPTEFATVKDKEKFYKHFIRFMDAGCPEAIFFAWFYKRLSNTFGHIAHYNRECFWETWFSDDVKKAAFIRRIVQWMPLGDPKFTFSDVEAALVDVCLTKVWLATYTVRSEKATEQEERATLARLKAKYEGAP